MTSNRPPIQDDVQFFEALQPHVRPEFAQQLHQHLKAQERENAMISTGSSLQPTVIRRSPTPEKVSFVGSLAVVEQILRARDDFFAEIREGIGLRYKVLSMMISSATFLAIYGGVMGLASEAHALPQMFSSAIKLPVLFLITLVICTPSLYFFNLLFGSRQTLGQNIALILTAVTVTSVLLVSMAPVALFFLSSAGGYEFFKLLNVGIFIVAGLMGISFLRQGFGASVDADNAEGRRARRAFFLAWVVLYAFVGVQMAWTLRPFIGSPGRDFEIVRQSDNSNFYSNMVDSAGRFLRGD